MNLLGVRDWGLFDRVLVGFGWILIIREFVLVVIAVIVIVGIYLVWFVLWLGLIIIGKWVSDCKIGIVDKFKVLWVYWWLNVLILCL